MRRSRSRKATPRAEPPATTAPIAPAARASIDSLLDRARSGDTRASEELFVALYDSLRKYAKVVMQGHAPSHTLTPTALVNEAFLRLAGRSCDFANRTHFIRIAARAMRQVLVDHARRRTRRKRASAGGRRVSHSILVAFEERAIDIVALDDALERLAAEDERSARVVELRFFGGLTVPDIAEILGVTQRTVERDWQWARMWLHAELA